MTDRKEKENSDYLIRFTNECKKRNNCYDCKFLNKRTHQCKYHLLEAEKMSVKRNLNRKPEIDPLLSILFDKINSIENDSLKLEANEALINFLRSRHNKMISIINLEFFSFKDNDELAIKNLSR